MSFEKVKDISKGILFYILAIIAIFILFKLFVFYIPFLIGFIIAEVLDPIIKFVKNKTNLNRKTSSIIVLLLFFLICIILIWLAIVFLVSEASSVLTDLNSYIDIILSKVDEFTAMLNFEKLKINNEIKIMFENTASTFISDVGTVVKNYLTDFIKGISKLPNFLVYAVITILSTYFISSDKFYILDRMEYHFPKKWVGNVREKIRKIKNSLGGYIKAEIIMILVTSAIVLVGLNIFAFIGLNIEYPLLMAVVIAFVDALPILGSGTVFIPWAIISFINSDITLGCSLLGLYIFITVAKQFIEPKLVSNKIGIHPIFTLIAMYTGFKFLGLIGLLAGPIILIILKNIFSNSIDKGIVNAVVDKF